MAVLYIFGLFTQIAIALLAYIDNPHLTSYLVQIDVLKIFADPLIYCLTSRLVCTLPETSWNRRT